MKNLKIKKSTVIPNLLVFTSFLLYWIWILNNEQSVSSIIYVTFFINFIVVLFGIINSKRAISLDKIFWYFFLFFLVIIPFYQITSGYAPRNMYLTDVETIQSNILILIFSIFYYTSYNTKSLVVIENSKERLKIPQSKLFYYTLTFVSVLSFLLVINLIGFSNLFIREEAVFREGDYGILIDLLLRSIPVISLSIYLWTFKKKMKTLRTTTMILNIIILFFITFVLNFPLSLSRYMIGTVYLGIVISAFKFSIFKNRTFDFLIIFSLVVIFPMMYLFKFYSLEEILTTNVNISFNNYNSVDFDAFQMIGRTLRYVNDVGLSNGKQIRSVLFFFVPRSIADIKGIPSGELVSTYQNISFTNLSSPIVAEGYIDFGIIGVILYACGLGKITKFFDVNTYNLLESRNVHFIEICFSFLLGFSVFVFRGALQPTILRLMGFFLFLIFLYLIYKPKSKYRSLL